MSNALHSVRTPHLGTLGGVVALAATLLSANGFGSTLNVCPGQSERPVPGLIAPTAVSTLLSAARRASAPHSGGETEHREAHAGAATSSNGLSVEDIALRERLARYRVDPPATWEQVAVADAGHHPISDRDCGAP